jgi:hypothetical protein
MSGPQQQHHRHHQHGSGGGGSGSGNGAAATSEGAATAAGAAGRRERPVAPAPPPDWHRAWPLAMAAVLLSLLVLQLPLPAGLRRARGGKTRRANANANAEWASAPCPVPYARLPLSSLASGDAVPWLMGGIYSNARPDLEDGRKPCLNCRRHGFWSDSCSFDPEQKPLLRDSQVWSEQLCGRDAALAWARGIAASEEEKEAAGAAAETPPSSSPAATFLTTTPCDLWRHLRGRALWIVGDSMAKDLYRALLCALIEFWPELNEKALVAAPSSSSSSPQQPPPGLSEARCAHLLEGAKVCYVHVVRGDLFVAETGPGPDAAPERPRVPVGVLPSLLLGGGGGGSSSSASSPPPLADASRDIFVLGFGLWHGLATREAYNRHLHELGAWVKRRSDEGLGLVSGSGNAASSSSSPLAERVLWLEAPKQHFADAPAGEFPDEWLWIPKRAKGPFECKADAGVAHDWGTGQLRVVEEEGGDSAAAAATTTLGEARARFASVAAAEKFDAAVDTGTKPLEALAVALSRNGTAAPNVRMLLERALRGGEAAGRRRRRLRHLLAGSLSPSPFDVADYSVVEMAAVGVRGEERGGGAGGAGLALPQAVGGGGAEEGDGNDLNDAAAAELLASALADLPSAEGGGDTAPPFTRERARLVASTAAARMARNQAAAEADAADRWRKKKQGAAAATPPPLRPPWPSPPPPLDPRQTVASYISSGGWRNQDARRVLGSGGGGFGLRFVPAYNASVSAHALHRRNARGAECSHYCLPSLPQVWVAALRAALDGSVDGRRAVPPAPAPAHQGADPFAASQAPEGAAIHWEKGAKAFGWPWKAEDMPEVKEERQQQKMGGGRSQQRRCDRLFCLSGGSSSSSSSG